MTDRKQTQCMWRNKTPRKTHKKKANCSSSPFCMKEKKTQHHASYNVISLWVCPHHHQAKKIQRSPDRKIVLTCHKNLIFVDGHRVGPKAVRFFSKTQRSDCTLFIYPTLSSASMLFFMTNAAVSLGWLRGK